MGHYLLTGERLRGEQRRYEEQVYAPNSVTARGVQVGQFLEFVAAFSPDRAPMPYSDEQVALYATWLARSMKYSSIQNYLSSLNYFLKQRGVREIDDDSYIVKATLKGIRRVNGNTPRRARPLLPAMLRRIFVNLSHSPGHMAWRAAVLVSFRALLRKAWVRSSDGTLRSRDFKFHDWRIIIRIRKGKTIQFAERLLEVPVACCCDADICVVHWVEQHFRHIPAGGRPGGFSGT